MFDIFTLEVSPILQNCRVLVQKGTSQAVVVDPGGDSKRILKLLSEKGLECGQIWLTHSHFDHCGAVQQVKQVTGAKLYGHPEEAMMRSHVVEVARMYGFPDGVFENCPEPDQLLTGGEKLEALGTTFDVLFTPGHAPGHLCFYNAEEKVLIAGDTLFAGSVGRTDLPGGSHKTLMRSIREKILSLPAETRVLPGHGPDTTVGIEAATNPFIQE